MCDYVEGELILSHHIRDSAGERLIYLIRNNLIGHVTLIETLDERMHAAERAMTYGGERVFARIGVPIGEEIWKIGYLNFYYKMIFMDKSKGLSGFDLELLSRSENNLLISTNALLYVTAHHAINVSGAAKSVDITLSGNHDHYKTLIGFPSSGSPYAPAFQKTVAILDTGFSPLPNCNIVDRHNFVDSSQQKNVDDDNGHGTLISAIISDLCPQANLSIYKVADSTGKATEWDTLAALATCQGEIINMSLAFGLQDRKCPACGRQSGSSRSCVFESVIDGAIGRADAPVIVAAAGNKGAANLAFPARFKGVVAVESVDASLNLSAFSNRGDTDAQGQKHETVFVAPGGDDNPAEYVASSNSGQGYYGTSCSAAYVSAVVYYTWEQPIYRHYDADGIIAHIKGAADPAISPNNTGPCGNGLIRFM